MNEERLEPEEWYPLRRKILERDVICMMCKEKQANEVDHIKPLKLGGSNEESNLQGLCSECHDKKTKQDLREMAGRRYKKKQHSVNQFFLD